MIHMLPILISKEQINILRNLAITRKVEMGIGFSIDFDKMLPNGIRLVTGTTEHVYYPRNFGLITAHTHPDAIYSNFKKHPPSLADTPHVINDDRIWDLVISSTGTFAYRANEALLKEVEHAVSKNSLEYLIEILQYNTNIEFLRLAQPPGLFGAQQQITVHQYIEAMRNILGIPGVGLDVLYFAPDEDVVLPVYHHYLADRNLQLRGPMWDFPSSVEDLEFYITHSDDFGVPYGDQQVE